MAKTPTVIDVTPTAAVTLIKEKREGMALLSPLQQEVELLEEITSPGELAVADELFGRIQKARKTWKLKMYGTPAKPGPIPAIRSGLDQLYALNRDVDKPLETMEEKVEARMKAYHLKLLREKQEAEAAKQREEDAAAAKIAELERKKAALRTPQAQAKVEAQILGVAQELDELQQQEEEEAVEVANSTARPRQIPVLKSVTDVAQGVIDGVIPEDCLTVNMVKVRAYYKSDPEAVALFPGIVLEDDVIIVGR